MLIGAQRWVFLGQTAQTENYNGKRRLTFAKYSINVAFGGKKRDIGSLPYQEWRTIKKWTVDSGLGIKYRLGYKTRTTDYFWGTAKEWNFRAINVTW